MSDCEVAAVTTGARTAMPSAGTGHASAAMSHGYRVFVLPGDRVAHELWGIGTVVSARGLGALVEFDYLGHKLFISAAALETSGVRGARERNKGLNSCSEVSDMVTETTPRPPAPMIRAGDVGSWTSRSVFGDGIPRTMGIPRNTVIALDVHGTLISRNQADDLRVVQAFRQTISGPAKEAGVRVVMVSAAPSRELQRVASLLDLGNEPAVAELGHVLMPRALETPPRLACGVTPGLLRVLLNLKRWLVKEGLPRGIFLEPKTVLVSLNWSEAPQERDRLVESIERYIGKHGLPLYVSVSDATLDVGISGVNKASGLATVMNGVGAGPDGMNILAVGDSRNDMDLLKISGPGLCGCPANSHATVKEYVAAQGGIVSDSSNLAGTLDALSQLVGRISPRTGKTAASSPFRTRPLVCEWGMCADA